MKYRYTSPKNYAMYASGSVLYSLPGRPAFPVRLASEIFLHCNDLRSRTGNGPPHIVFDPCCGGAYLLTTLGFEHTDSIKSLIVSDADPKAVELGERNLHLLDIEGIENRIKEVEKHLQDYARVSYSTALEHLQALREKVMNQKTYTIKKHCFVADATNSYALLNGLKEVRPDIIIADIPHGKLTKWLGSNNLQGNETVSLLLDSLMRVTHPDTVIAISGPKRSVMDHSFFTRMRRIKIGTRQITFLSPRN